MNSTSKVIVIFGAGNGLSAAAARRFGREGYRVALVARNAERLAVKVGQLAELGIEATAFPADLSSSDTVPALVDSIRAQLGRIDAIYYAPLPAGELGFAGPSAMNIENRQHAGELFLWSFVAAVKAVLPEMRQRGDGAIFLAEGFSASKPIPGISTVQGLLTAAARSFVYSLAGEVKADGIYAGVLTIGAIIGGSDAAANIPDAEDYGELGGVKIIKSSSDEIAEILWNMYVQRSAVEHYHPASLAELA